MAEIGALNDKLLESLNELHNSVSSKKWSSFNRASFVHSLNSSIHELQGIESILESMRIELDRSPESNSPDVESYLTELHSLLAVLKRNANLEQSRQEKERMREGESAMPDIAAKVHAGELYSSIEQKLLSLLLKMRYLGERISVFEKKVYSAPIAEKGVHRNVLQLLESKEEELQEMRGKFEKARSNIFLGRIEENTSNDLEHELNELSRKLEGQNVLFEKEMSAHEKQLNYLLSTQFELKRRQKIIDELLMRQLEKSSILITSLKKERDYAKKIVLDIEHETLQLRNSYSKQLLNLEQDKLKAKKQVREQLGKTTSRLQKELRDKHDLLHHFRSIAEEKDESIRKLNAVLAEKNAKKKAKKK
ncbi:MAG: hypothetical protein V1494_06230 [Candidatus Diapherotrites archaeon]